MGSVSSTQLAAKCYRAGTELHGANRAAVAQAALTAKQTMLAGAAAVGLRPGAPLPRHRKTKWGVGFDILGVANPTARVRARGPYWWIDRGTKPHVILPRRARQARRGIAVVSALTGAAVSGAAGMTSGSRSNAVLRTPWGPRRWVQHPGAPARPFVTPTMTMIRREIPAVIRAAQRRALISAFR
jgi:hypothetical protein